MTVYFAELNSNNVVIRVIVGNPDSVSHPMDPAGEQWCSENIPNDLGIDLVNGVYPGVSWKQTFDDNITRGNFAAKNYTYDSVNDVFISTQPYASWVLDGSYKWKPPVGFPIVDDLGNSLPRGAFFPDSLSIGWSEPDLTWIGTRKIGEVVVTKLWNSNNLTWNIKE